MLFFLPVLHIFRTMPPQVCLCPEISASIPGLLRLIPSHVRQHLRAEHIIADRHHASSFCQVSLYLFIFFLFPGQRKPNGAQFTGKG